MLIQNLASSAARKGGLSENEAENWAETQVDKILQSGNFDSSDIEELIANPSTSDLLLKILLTFKEKETKNTETTTNNFVLSEGYTSTAGNTYFQGIRLSDRLLIKCEFSQGFNTLFLKGLGLYKFKGKDVKLISRRLYNCQVWSEKFARRECLSMLKDFLKIQTDMLREIVPQSLIEDSAKAVIDQAMANQCPRLQ